MHVDEAMWIVDETACMWTRRCACGRGDVYVDEAEWIVQETVWIADEVM